MEAGHPKEKAVELVLARFDIHRQDLIAQLAQLEQLNERLLVYLYPEGTTPIDSASDAENTERLFTLWWARHHLETVGLEGAALFEALERGTLMTQ